MIVWSLFGGLVSVVVAVIVYREWKARRQPTSGAHSVMTKTTDGELLQFLVRPTRKTGKELR